MECGGKEQRVNTAWAVWCTIGTNLWSTRKHLPSSNPVPHSPPSNLLNQFTTVAAFLKPALAYLVIIMQELQGTKNIEIFFKKKLIIY